MKKRVVCANIEASCVVRDATEILSIDLIARVAGE